MSSARYIVPCVHDVTPRHFDRLRRIHDLLETVGIGSRYAMLVVPDFWREWPLLEHPEFCAWLRARADEGVEMLLHGFTHRDESAHTSAAARLAASTLTAREGEFFGLDEATARERLIRGRAVVEEAVGRPVTGFVAPAWLYSAGTHAALRELGFTVAEDHLSVWRPTDGKVVHRSPVVSYASRDRRRVLGSLVWSRTASIALAPLSVVRHAIHPHDLDVPSLEAEIERSLRDFLTTRTPLSYEGLAAA
ncbi:MAG: polysaccharide deacetylase family protein [Myxococcales bacterium]|nr:polysaccharide deacetylase family protein [Myxococcales bacterium]MCB9531329.1 polysaccharide deacetylase family protein [Myxococcales bacterium]